MTASISPEVRALMRPAAAALEPYDPAFKPADTPAGVWIMQNDSGPLGPWDATRARRVSHDSLYAARVIRDADGVFRILGFSDTVDGEFVGEILDPVELVFD